MSILKSTNSGQYTRLTLDVLKKLHYEHPKFPLEVQALNPGVDCLDLTKLVNTSENCHLELRISSSAEKNSFHAYFTFVNSNGIKIQVSSTPQDIHELNILEKIWTKQNVLHKEIYESDFRDLMFAHFYQV